MSNERNLFALARRSMQLRITTFSVTSMLCLALSNGVACAAKNVSEVRGTWLTTTANTALATPADTAASMRRLSEIGINTVYVESWKNGYTQFPSDTLERTIGLRQRPVQMPQDPSDSSAQRARPPRDLLQESLIEAHRNGLIYVAWFEYGFMAAYKDTMNHLRTQKPEWLSRDAQGSEVAPNGFVWLNPLHPEARRFLLDLVLEAVDKYDLDGIQLDDRIVWPYINMGYDDYTQTAYAAEHAGKRPPSDVRDPEWMRWRAEKVNQYAKLFVQELRASRPGLLISLSPAVYPWSWEHYLLNWPAWSAWDIRDKATEAETGQPFRQPNSAQQTPRWDEFIPQTYRMSYDAFEKSWREQVTAVRLSGGDRQQALLAGIRIVGDGPDSSWLQLKQSIELTRKLGNGGHVLWFSRGVLDLYADQLRDFYQQSGAASSPRFPSGWRQKSIALHQNLEQAGVKSMQKRWTVNRLSAGKYRLIGQDQNGWHYLQDHHIKHKAGKTATASFVVSARYTQLELLIDRRRDMLLSREN